MRNLEGQNTLFADLAVHKVPVSGSASEIILPLTMFCK